MVGWGRCPQWDGDGARSGTGMEPMVGQGWCPQRDGAPRQPAGRRRRSTYQQPAQGGCVYPLTDFFLLAEPGSRFNPNTGAPSGTASSQPLLRWTKPRLPSPGPAFGCGPDRASSCLGAPGDALGGAWGGDDAGGPWGCPSWRRGMLPPRGTREEEDAQPRKEDARGGAGDAATCGCPRGEVWGRASPADHGLRRGSDTQIFLLLWRSLCP